MLGRGAGAAPRRRSSGRRKRTAGAKAGAGRADTQQRSPRPAPPSPIFILLTITKAIYLFRLERGPAPVASLEGSAALRSPACVPPLSSPGRVWCAPPRGHGCLRLGPATPQCFLGDVLPAPEQAPQGALASPGERGGGLAAPRLWEPPRLHVLTYTWAHPSLHTVLFLPSSMGFQVWVWSCFWLRN